MACMSLGTQQKEEDLTEELGSGEGRGVREGSLFYLHF